MPSAAQLVRRQRRQDRRHARRRGHRRSRPRRCDDGTRDRRARRSSSTRTPGRCPRTRRCSSARAPRSASSTSRSRAARRSQSYAGRRHDPARAGHADAGRARRVPEHVRRQDARGRRRPNLEGFGDRVRRPRRVDQHRDRRVPAAAARHHPGDAQNLSAPRHAPRALRPRARRHGARSSRPRPRRRRRCSRNLDTTMARAARGRAAVHPGLDHRGQARRSTPAIRELPAASGRSWPTPRA